MNDFVHFAIEGMREAGNTRIQKTQLLLKTKTIVFFLF